MEAEDVEFTTPVQSSSPELEVWDYEQLREEYGF
jgi:putative transposase